MPPAIYHKDLRRACRLCDDIFDLYVVLPKLKLSPVKPLARSASGVSICTFVLVKASSLEYLVPTGEYNIARCIKIIIKKEVAWSPSFPRECTIQYVVRCIIIIKRK